MLEQERLVVNRIVIVLRTFPSASETFILQELKMLERLGFEMQIFAYRREPTERCSRLVEELRASITYMPEGLHASFSSVFPSIVLNIANRRFWKALYLFFFDLVRDRTRRRIQSFLRGLWLSDRICRKPDRIHAHFLDTPASVARYASFVSGIPWSCSAHAYDIWTLPCWELEQKIQDAQWITACTRAGFEELKMHSSDSGSISLNYHGLDGERFSPSIGGSPPTSDVIERPNGPIRIISAGRLEKKKGIDTLLEALALAEGSISSWRLTVVGDGSEEESLKEFAALLGIQSRIRWLGWRRQEVLISELRNNDLFVLPSRTMPNGDRDGLPNVFLEAMSQQVCCVGTNVGGIPELIADHVTGRLFQPEDAKGLSRILIDLTTDTEKRIKMARAGQVLLNERFLLSKTIHGIVEGLSGRD